MKKNKKAILLPETLKLLIAIIILGLLIYLAYSLYSIFIAKPDLEKARETLSQIAGKADFLMKEGKEGDSVDYLVTAPKDWYMLAFEEGEKSPKQCKEKNCLCICKERSTIEYCDKMSACKIIEYIIKFEHYPVIGLLNLPLNIFLRKENSQILISKTTFETNVIDELLKRKINMNNFEKTISESLLELASNCQGDAQKILKDANKDLKSRMEAEFKKFIEEKSKEKGYKVGLGFYISVYSGAEFKGYILDYINEPAATADLNRVEIKEQDLCKNEQKNYKASLNIFILEPKQK